MSNQADIIYEAQKNTGSIDQLLAVYNDVANDPECSSRLTLPMADMRQILEHIDSSKASNDDELILKAFDAGLERAAKLASAKASIYKMLLLNEDNSVEDRAANGFLFIKLSHLAIHIRALQTRQPEPVVQANKWEWWGGDDEERYLYGPCETKEDIIQEATHGCTGEFQDEENNWKIGIHICEAQREPLRVADWIDADSILERAEDNIVDSDRVSAEHDEGPWFECSTEQSSDLESRIKTACDDWQKDHGIKFVPFTFSNSRNHEFIVVNHLDCMKGGDA